jgi:hypothetical protein
MTMIDLFEKVKQASKLPTNLDEGVAGRMQMREDHMEGPLHNEPPQYSTAVERELHEGSAALLGRSFEGVPGMAAADKGLLKELFQNFGTAATTSHSPLLQKAASHAPPPTLAETLRRLR